LLESYPEFRYKEATLDPTNPRDCASDRNTDLANTLRPKPESTELVGERISASGPVLYIAWPSQIKDGACLGCHSVPQFMRDINGVPNGFG